MPQRVVEVPVQQAALVLRRRHVVLTEGSDAPQPRRRGRAVLLDDALVHGLAELAAGGLGPQWRLSACHGRAEVSDGTPGSSFLNKAPCFTIWGSLCP